MKKTLALILALVMILALAACGQSAPAAAPAADKPAEAAPAAADKKPSAGFVTFGLGGDFFQALADTFVKTMNDAGWDASYVDGEFNPTSQIAAMENYIAQGVDVIVLWSVAPEAMEVTPLGVDTRHIRQSVDESGGQVEIDYVVDMEHAVVARNKFSITIRQMGE